ncbi:unnamed protein product [Sphagnum troendelagicum]|uniref:Uncharacterized protein n=1 Tax=Sphagnum troendelagicum TaxID=128251 RepID=A0ABP0UUQ0_9BRYO
MEQDDEEFEQLLCEIPHVTSTNPVVDVPRATSAPPHLEELQRVHGSEIEEGSSIGMHEDEALPAVKPFVDIRCDEHYESFYRSYAGVKKLPPPMDNRTLYSDLPVLLSPKSSSSSSGSSATHISPFLAELTLDGNPVGGGHQRKQHRLDMQRKQHQLTSLQHQLQPQQAQQQQREPSPSFQAPGAHQYEGVPSSQNDRSSSSDHHLTAAFGNLSFEEGSSILLQSLIDDNTGGDNRAILSNGSVCGRGSSAVVQHPLSNGHGLAGSNGLYSHLDIYGTGSSAPSYEFYASRSSPSPDLFTAQQLVEAQAQAQATATAAQYAHLEEQQQQHRLYVQQQLMERQKQIQLLASLQAQVNGRPGGGGTYPSAGSMPIRGSRNASALQQLGFAAAANAQNNQALERKLRLQQALNPPDVVWGSNTEISELGFSDNSCRTQTVGSVCRYYLQGFCSRSETCPFLHSPLHRTKAVSHTTPVAVKEASRSTAVRDGRLPPYPDKILRRNTRASHSGKTNSFFPVAGAQRIVDMVVSNGHGHGYLDGHCSSGSGHISPTDLSDTLAHPQLRIQDHMEFDVGRLMTPHSLQQQQPPKYTTLEEVEGHIYLIAKDQHGCRFLQKKFDEGGPKDVEKIFHEIISHITELMKDPFGNYLVQKLLEVCDEKQRMEILRSVTMDGELVRISLNMHGTRAVQKLIETLKSPEQVAMVITALSDGVVELIKDLNGNHVVQRCLQKLSHEDSQFIFDAAALHCVEIATHRHGCCVMQRCVDFALDHQRQRLVAEVAANALTLSQDPYGNYVVQYILDLKTAWSSTEVMARLEGNYAFLSMQKFSSNVVEKCLKLGVEEPRSRLVRELMTSPHLGQLLQDQYANYVIQSALSVCKGALHSGLVDAIRPHLPALRNSPYGKRILSRTNPKK